MITRIYSDSSTICGEESWISFSNSSEVDNSNVIDIEFEDSVLKLREIAFKYVSPVVIAVGVLGNILNLFVLSKPFLKGPMKIYLTSLAISDLGVMFSTIPLLVRLNRVQGKTYPVAFFHAHIEICLTNVFIATSVFIVVCLTVDRYLSVCLPKMFRNFHKTRNAKTAVMVSALAGIVVSIPLAALKTACLMKNADDGSLHWDFHENVAVTRTVYWNVYLVAEGFLTRFGPAFLLAILNIFIIRKFRKITARRLKLLANTTFLLQHAERKNNSSIRNRKHYHEEKRLIVLLHAIVGLFFITMTPAVFLSLLYAEYQEANFGFQAFRAIANNLEISNFALNFYVYCLCSKEFREALVKVFVGCKVAKNNNNNDGVKLENVDEIDEVL